MPRLKNPCADLMRRDGIVRLKLTVGGPEEWSIKIVDAETGRLFPALRGSISYTVDDAGQPIISAKFYAVEIEDEHGTYLQPHPPG